MKIKKKKMINLKFQLPFNIILMRKHQRLLHQEEELLQIRLLTRLPVYQDSKLANTLSKLEIGDMIPPELYGVVAEILVFVDECDRIRGKVKH